MVAFPSLVFLSVVLDPYVGITFVQRNVEVAEEFLKQNGFVVPL